MMMVYSAPKPQKQPLSLAGYLSTVLKAESVKVGSYLGEDLTAFAQRKAKVLGESATEEQEEKVEREIMEFFQEKRVKEKDVLAKHPEWANKKDRMGLMQMPAGRGGWRPQYGRGFGAGFPPRFAGPRMESPFVPRMKEKKERDSRNEPQRQEQRTEQKETVKIGLESVKGTEVEREKDYRTDRQTGELERGKSGKLEAGQKSESDEEEDDENPGAEEPDGAHDEDLIETSQDPLTGTKTEPEHVRSWVQTAIRIQTRVSSAPNPQDQRDRIKELLEVMQSKPDDPDAELETQTEELLKNLPEKIPNHEAFEAASFQTFWPAWDELLRKTGRKSARMVLGWLKHGFRPRFSGVSKAKPEKRKVVEEMLRRLIGAEHLHEFLTGRKPHRIEFPNHASFYREWEFSKGEIEKNLRSGAIAVWKREWGEPEVVSPMGVVDSAGKLRLICNDRYLNLFLTSIPFQYEKLRDVLNFTDQGSYVSTADLKSGYFHVPVHPAYWKYFAFKVGGVTFCYKVLCFGFAQACYVFTKLVPDQMAKWLGFIVDTNLTEFRLHPKKIQKIKDAMEELITSTSTTSRAIARAAGILVSAAPAVLPVAIYSRALYEALNGKEGWDSHFPTPEIVKETASFWVQNIERFNGRRWWPRPVQIRICVDASAVGFGGYAETPSRERLTIAGTFTADQAKTSSTEREIMGYVEAIKTVAENRAEEVKGTSILVTGDNQAAVGAINGFRSSKPFIVSNLKVLLEAAAEGDFDVRARWVPRNELTQADALSRKPDPGDWTLTEPIFQLVKQTFGVEPDIDLYASGQFHKAKRFVTKYYCPGCTAVHANAQDWNEIVEPREWAWAFPPPGLAIQALKRLELFKVNALVCVPAPKGSMVDIVLGRLQGARVEGPILIPKSAASCLPSLRVPNGTLNPAFLGLAVYSIQWHKT
ncbi:DNA/RNA polymerases [Klebsormidium nitens]|uniref:DNA/RNA polymerases n=1 Tax=Klebsormidium nitens TaxID=105231 RepID=A0A1Y1IQT3_KLENI|nr:DNA/RNA polymerases [Klebsormidium nitens]|eukprot:GAQ91116.1 DNA/RNA polymerases [Klebsormidium nitens]